MSARDKKDPIKRALQYMKIAALQGNVGFRAMLASESFQTEVIDSLEEVSGWTNEDEQEARELGLKFELETHGKTLKDKSKRIRKILGYTGGAAAGVSVIGLIARWFLRRRKNDEGAE